MDDGPANNYTNIRRCALKRKSASACSLRASVIHRRQPGLNRNARIAARQPVFIF